MRAAWTVAAAVGTLAAFAVFAWVLERPSTRTASTERVERPAPEALPEASGFLPRLSVTAGELFGVNEGMTLPHHALSAGLTPADAFVLQGRRVLLDDLGVRRVRLNSHSYPGLNHLQLDDWRTADEFFAAPALEGLDVVAVIGPWPGTRTGNYTDAYVPEDMDAYTEWVRQVVERYGDHVTAWEIDNEPDLHNSEAPRGGKEQAEFQTPAEYAEVLLATSAAIREVDPEALIASGGMYRAMTPVGRAYYEEVLATDGVLDAIDVVSLHCYFATPDTSPIRDLFAVTRAFAPDKPVWITETSVPSSAERSAEASPEWQARMVVRLHAEMLIEGADRIYWHTLFDAPEAKVDGPIGFRTNSLYDQSTGRVVAKPAALTYARLTRRLADQPLDGVVAQDGLLVFRDGWLVVQGSVDTPDGATQVEDLLTGAVTEPTPTTEAPAWIAR
ncbi:MAG: hypothetical protein GY913_20395 [Proteobacteria bacterium]|nr:hypothetical protein [Pseudomonadota bacterium]MCP4919268.1 hypothetical protein [Pseudomonadota bacterium]